MKEEVYMLKSDTTCAHNPLYPPYLKGDFKEHSRFLYLRAMI